LNRHRHFAISQRSTRYTKEEDAAIVLEPYYAELFHKGNLIKLEDGWDTSTNGNIDRIECRLICNHLNTCEELFTEYKREVESLIQLNPNKLEGFDLRKWARGKARNILLHGLETRGTWTGNHRAWRWFIELRSAENAEPEIRRLAHFAYCAVKPIAPHYYEEIEVSNVVDSIPVYTPKFRKI
jgi:thymidylate synthase ThyX